MKTEPTWMTVKKFGYNWDETEQTYLGNISWEEAVKIAKTQNNEVRLTTTPGYLGQGHYIQPTQQANG